MRRRGDLARPGSSGAGKSERRRHKGRRGGDGGRLGGEEGPGPQAERGATSARAPRRTSPARLRPAMPAARPATPAAAAASWPGLPSASPTAYRASPTARSTGWGLPPPANQKAYAKMGAEPGRSLGRGLPGALLWLPLADPAPSLPAGLSLSEIILFYLPSVFLWLWVSRQQGTSLLSPAGCSVPRTGWLIDTLRE